MKQICMLFVLLLPCVSADVVVSKVLSNPTNTESGGEAVEIMNMGNGSVELSGVVLATSASMTDATLPAVWLLPGERFLIADEGWDEHKDDPDWRSADHEEKITLGNEDAGVALMRDGAVLDVVGWGEEEELLEHTPTSAAGEGVCLLRVADTDNNGDDFIEGACGLFDGTVVLVETVVEEGFSAWFVNENDSVRAGEPLVVRASGPGIVLFAGRNVSLVEVNGSLYEARLDTMGLSAGGYAVHVNDVVLDVEILPVAFVRVGKTKVLLNPDDSLMLENLGSVVAEVRIAAEDLTFGEHTIRSFHLRVDGESLDEERVLVLTPGEKKHVTVRLDETDAAPGVYRSLLRITYGS